MKNAAVPATPEAVTVTIPLVAADGTVATICVGLQLVAVAKLPLKETVLVPCVPPKFVPVIVTNQPVGAVAGDTLKTFGAPGVMKTTPLLSVPATFTTTDPVVEPVGTIAVSPVEPQLVTLATVPLNDTVLVPCVGPKSAPMIVTKVPAGPNAGDRLNIDGTFITVKFNGLLGTPATVTITLPVVAPVATSPVIDVADQLVTVIAVPFTVTVLLPWVSPKFRPEICTGEPVSPLVGDTLAISGVGRTVNSTRLLPTPPTSTTILPVVSFGTATTILVGDQLVTVAALWFRRTVLAPWIAPKPEPTIVKENPTGPELGDKDAISGSAETTVIVVEPQIEPVHALTVVEPVATPKVTPRLLESLETVATAALDVLHVTEAKVCVLLSLNVPLAPRF